MTADRPNWGENNAVEWFAELVRFGVQWRVFFCYRCGHEFSRPEDEDGWEAWCPAWKSSG